MDRIVADNIIPYNKAYCTYILNAAPNRDGRIDENAVASLKRIGQIWKNTGHIVDVPEAPDPIVDINIAVGKPCDSSWSDDMNIMDFANDDNFGSCWVSSPAVSGPWWRVDLDKGTPVNMVVITEREAGSLKEYVVEYLDGRHWTALRQAQGPAAAGRVHIHRFPTVPADAIRVRFKKWDGTLSIAEIGVYTPYRK